MQTEYIKDFHGRLIGTIEIYPNGDKRIKDFYGRLKGLYFKNQNITKDFYGRYVGNGDQLMRLLDKDYTKND